ncbi:MAG: aminotransferase class IV [Deltaproteobacteria bacterium]|nr:aminotransferase class IV [Deltaproteobacteria bacterium]
MAIFYVDGQFVPSDEATIPIDDLALLRGYGIFDFLKTYRGKPIFLGEHIERLQQSAEQIGLDLPWSRRELTNIVMQTLDKNNLPESNIRMVVTGGSSPDFITPQGKPRLLVLVTPLAEQPEWWYSEGVKIITIDSERNIPAAKSIDYIPATMALKEARRQDAIEAVYVDRAGYVLEGTTSNLFLFSDDRLVTPGRAILNGITRQVVLKLAEKTKETEIRDIKAHELYAAEEVFITGSNKEIVPVVRVDQTIIGNGRPGRHTKALMEAFVAYTHGKAQAESQT